MSFNKMDFLPAGNEESERLKYTQSFVIPNDRHSSGQSTMGIKVLPPHRDTNPASNIQHPQQEQKSVASSGIRSDIQSYLKNRGSKVSLGGSSFENPRVNQSIQNGISKNSSIGNRDPLSHNTGAARPAQQIESKAYRLSQIDEAVFKQVQAEMGQHEAPRSNIEQSNVKVSMQSQVRPYQSNKLIQHSGQQLINLQDSRIPQQSRDNHEQLLKSIKLAPKPFQYDEDFSKPKQPVHLKRNLIPQNNQKEFVSAPISVINHQPNHEFMKQNIMPEYTSINIHDQVGANVPITSNKINYNRHLTHNFQEVKQNQQIIIPVGEYSSLPKHNEQITHIRKLDHSMQQIPINQPFHLNQINHQEKIAHFQEQIPLQLINLPAQYYQYPSNINKGTNFVRKIQHEKPQAPMQLKIQQLSQNSFNNLNKSHSYSRNLQHQPQPQNPNTKVNVDLLEQSLYDSSHRRSLLRNLKHEELPQDTKIIINSGDESILSNSSHNKSKLLPRNLQHEPIPQTILYVDTGKDQASNFAHKRDNSILSRNLQHQEIPQTILFINTGKEQQANFASKRDSSGHSRNLQHQQMPGTILYADTGKEQISNFANKRDSSILSRNLQHQQIPETLIFADTGKEQITNFAHKRDSSVLSRNLQHQQIPDTLLNVSLGDQSVDFAHKKDSSILSRKLQHEEPRPDTKLYINPSEQPERLSSSQKLKLSRSLQHQQQPIIAGDQHDPALEYSQILPYEPQSFSLPTQQILAHQTQILNNQRKSQYTRNLVRENTGNDEDNHIPIILKSEEGAVRYAQPSRATQRRNLQAIPQEKPKQIRINMNQNSALPKTNSSVPLRRTLQHEIHQQPIVIQQQQPPKIIQEPFQISQNWGDHSGSLVQPKSQIKYQRNLKQEQFNDPHSEVQSVLPQLSHRVIQNEISQPPHIIQQPQQLPLNFAGETTLANQRQQILLKRHLLPQQNPLPELNASLLEKTCEGWNPSSKIFNLFKLSKHHQKTGPISFGKTRINTGFKN